MNQEILPYQQKILDYISQIEAYIANCIGNPEYEEYQTILRDSLKNDIYEMKCKMTANKEKLIYWHIDDIKIAVQACPPAIMEYIHNTCDAISNTLNERK